MEVSQSVPEPDIALAERLFAVLEQNTRDTRGVTRPSYGDGEQFAHHLITAEARKAGLATSTDAAGNLYIRLPGVKSTGKTILIGSHLDSVPMGGNFDGAAGVLSGLAVIVGWKRAGFRLNDDVTVMAIRAEESNWFPHSYVGSKAALGLLPPDALDVRRSDSGRTLAEHMADCGFQPDIIKAGQAQIEAQDIRAYIEVHIEQGPILVERKQPVALVTSIRGSFRYREARIIGEYAHSGAVPRRYRRDAVIAAADFIMRMQNEWLRFEAEGQDMVFTVGMLSTDPTQHAFSKIAGEVGFSIDVRSHNPATLASMRERVTTLADQVARQYSVRVELGPLTGSTPVGMSRDLLNLFETSMAELGLPSYQMACGAGHDAAVFAGAGVPTLMLFVRNEHGSHNPEESMDMADFAITTQLLARGLSRIC